MEQKKGFLEEGGGFDRIWDGTADLLRKFRKNRFSRVAGLVLLALVMISFVLGIVADCLLANVGHIDLNRHMQDELGIAARGDVSDAELAEINTILYWVAQFQKYDDYLLDDYRERIGGDPFTSQEEELLTQYAALREQLYSVAQKLNSIWWPFAAFLLGWWMAGGFRKWKSIVLSVLSGFCIAAAFVVAAAVWLNCDTVSAVHTLCGWLFTSDVWMLSTETSILAKIYPAEHTAGVLTESFIMAGRELLYEIGEFALFLMVGVAVSLVSVAIEKFKKKKQRNYNESSHL